MNKLSKPIALLLITLFYVSTYITIHGIALHLDVESIVLKVLLLDVIATVIIYVFSVISKNASVYDPYWSVIPVFIVGYLIYLNPEGNMVRQALIFGVVFMWAVRLTANWARGWSGFEHQDWRYTKLAEDTGKAYWIVNFLGIHLFPTILVFAGCLPLFYTLANPAPVSVIEIIAVIVCLWATWMEWTADEQLRKFKRNAKPDQYMNEGIWRWCRHPNYLGEITFWLGIFLFIPLAGHAYADYYTAVGVILMLLLFRFISIPMMEKRNLVRRKNYTEYIKNVPMLIPRLSRKQ